MGANGFFGGLFSGEARPHVWMWFSCLACVIFGNRLAFWARGKEKNLRCQSCTFELWLSNQSKSEGWFFWPFALGDVYEFFHRAQWSLHPVSPPKSLCLQKSVSGEIGVHCVVFQMPLTSSTFRGRTRTLSPWLLHAHYRWLLCWGSTGKLCWIPPSSQNLRAGVLNYSRQVPGSLCGRRLIFGLRTISVCSLFCFLSQESFRPVSPALQRPMPLHSRADSFCRWGQGI